ncbi:hypothetical protein Y032_0495g2470 [Ancylostoma ceylanicum]|uniref:Uncharacterized protein n=1 Tax=Ancylostoma ceylanicum TaxID=53326 RepID=A0A016WVV4_9BILA|nr:hypothetical protein Y032_0495g2470 [Ancylostoma ceylanicum]
MIERRVERSKRGGTQERAKCILEPAKKSAGTACIIEVTQGKRVHTAEIYPFPARAGTHLSWVISMVHPGYRAVYTLTSDPNQRWFAWLTFHESQPRAKSGSVRMVFFRNVENKTLTVANQIAYPVS